MGVNQAIDINAEDLRTVLALLNQHLPGTAAWVYGSPAQWTSLPQSDLDLVVFATPEQAARVGALREAFEESTLPFRVDLFVWGDVPATFREQIKAERVVLVMGQTANERDVAVDDHMQSIQLSGSPLVASVSLSRDRRRVRGATEMVAIGPYGKFSSEYIEDRLGNLCDQVNGIQTGPFGTQLHKEDYVSVGTPIITVEHLGENRIRHRNLPHVSEHDRKRLSKYILNVGDIVFSRVGSVDRRALVKEAERGWLFSGRCLRIRPDRNKIDSGYLSYFFGLPSFKEHIRAIAVGATMPSLNTQILSSIGVPHPRGLIEQRAISHVLGTLDDKIELNQRMTETLEAMARALFIVSPGLSILIPFEPRSRAATRGCLNNLPTSSPTGSWNRNWERYRRGGTLASSETCLASELNGVEHPKKLRAALMCQSTVSRPNLSSLNIVSPVRKRKPASHDFTLEI